MAASSAVLVARARALTGYTDLGSDAWRVGLDRLLIAVEFDVHDPGAIKRIEDLITQRLVQRLRIEGWFAEHASEADVPIEGPLVICGLPRTGTTALHHLMSVDPQFRYLRSWEVNDPVPPPVAANEHEDPRRPTKPLPVDVRHIVAVDGPAEDWPIHALAFDHAELVLPVPSYSEWWRTRGHPDVFAYHDRFLRLLHSHRPPHHWLLKLPSYIFLIAEMSAHYPGARFVVTHRDPVTAIASTCSVIADSRQRRVPTWSLDRSFGPMLLAHWARGMERAMEARVALGEDMFIDIAQSELEANPRNTAERVYEGANLTLAGPVADAMKTWAERNGRGSRGAHEYDLDKYGLTAAQVTKSFAPYLERYGHLCRTGS